MEEDQSEMSLRGATSEDERMNKSQASSTIECHDDTTGECGAEARPCPMEMEMEEKNFVSRLYTFMKDRGTPIERIPHLGFKQINLWRIYKAVEKLGGYESVTSRRLWKNVYDELGGSPGSTSAATCTRRHYERLVLPFERSLRGEEDKPLPVSKPQKQYKRNSDGKISKTEGKRKRTQSDRDTDSEALEQTEAASQCETGTHTRPSAWTIASDRPHHPDVSQTNRGADNLSAPVHAYSHLVQVPAQCPWSGYSLSAVAGEVISPLEKKKRVCQASLGLPPSPHGDEKDRPSVIHSSQSPGLAYSGRNCNSSEGSPQPPSSSSSASRSPSPYSVSSEDSLVLTEDKPGSNTVLPAHSSRIINGVSGCGEENKRLSCSPKSKDLTGEPKDVPYVCSGSRNKGSFKGQSKDPGWRPSSKLSSRNPTHLWRSSTSASFPIKSDWIPASTSSFTKVMPKAVQPLRPIPFPPSYKPHQSRSVQHDESLACAKKLHNIPPWFHHTEKREKARTAHAKPLTSAQQHPLSHSHSGLPVSYYLAGYDRSGRDSRNQTPIPPPAFIHSRMRLPLSHPVYRHMPVGPAHSALIGSAIYSYPYHIPVWGPQTAYSLPDSMYPHKL